MSSTILERAARDDGGYDVDFYAWTIAQAALLRDGKLSEADIVNIAEEIESLGKEQFSKLASAVEIVLLHMLKWDHQPERRSRSWAVSIATHRERISDVLEDNPSLRRRQSEAVLRAHRLARLRAADETGLLMSRFPTECPYSLDEVLTRAFPLPEE